jgi:RNA polymerase sigma factor (sigma-70 family)
MRIPPITTFRILNRWPGLASGGGVTNVPFPAVVERYYRELRRFLSRMVNDSDTASDIAQESYARVLSITRSGRVIENPRALLYRTGRNLVTDMHRRATVRAALDIDELAEHEEPAAPRTNQPDELWASAQRTQLLLAAIEALPPRCREAFILHKFDGLNHAEVASRMGISRNMLEKHIIRGLLSCRTRLAEIHEPQRYRTEVDKKN